MTHDLLRPSRRDLLGLMGATLLWPGDGWAESSEAIIGTAFGTTWQILGPSGAGLTHIKPDIDALFSAIDRQMSPWRRDSDLSGFNSGPAGWHAADEELIHVTQCALDLAEASGGAFDPTVGPLVARWGFGPIEGGGAPDWRGLSVGRGRLSKARADLTLDLCGIAKGWALDRAIGLAAAAGFDNLLVDLGGELATRGRHPSGRPWRVAVEHPVPGQPAPAVLRLLSGEAVATSGLRTQSYQLGGRTFGHIVNPGKGAPADDGLGSVTVLAADAMTADGWATALFAAGATAGPALARKNGISALILVRDGPAFRQIRTGAIEEAML